MKIASVADRNFYKFYERVTKRRKRLIDDPKAVSEVQMAIFETVADLFIKNDAGLYIKGIGYLCHMMKKNFDFTIRMGRILNESRNGMGYYHMALEIADRRSKYVHFGISTHLKRRAIEEAVKGRPYRFMYREVREYTRKGNRYFQPRSMDLRKLSCAKKDI